MYNRFNLQELMRRMFYKTEPDEGRKLRQIVSIWRIILALGRLNYTERVTVYVCTNYPIRLRPA
jgi:hypothetical protein